MRDFPNLYTDRLYLRELVQLDKEVIFNIYTDHNNMRWYGSDIMLEIIQAEKLIENFSACRKLEFPSTYWGIECNKSKKLLGFCGLFNWNPYWKVCTIGYILSNSAQNKGFMREAILEIIKWGFKNMKVNRIEATVEIRNLKSINLLEQIGFKYEGLLRQGGFWMEESHDLKMYSLLHEEYFS